MQWWSVGVVRVLTMLALHKHCATDTFAFDSTLQGANYSPMLPRKGHLGDDSNLPMMKGGNIQRRDAQSLPCLTELHGPRSRT